MAQDCDVDDFYQIEGNGQRRDGKQANIDALTDSVNRAVSSAVEVGSQPTNCTVVNLCSMITDCVVIIERNVAFLQETCPMTKLRDHQSVAAFKDPEGGHSRLNAIRFDHRKNWE